MDTRVTVGSETRLCSAADALTVADEMGARPDNLPVFERIQPLDITKVETPAELARVFQNADATELRSDGGKLNADGLARSMADRVGAESAGYVTQGTVVARGQEVNSTGVINAREKRAQWEQEKPTLEGCASIVERVAGEGRKDMRAIPTHSLRMTESGALVVDGVPHTGHFNPTPRAVRGLVSRLGCGGADYLLNACTPKLRAINVNHQAVELEKAERAAREAFLRVEAQRGYRAKEPEPFGQTVLRTRRNGECYAVVSPSYSPFDADKVAGIVAAGVSPDCRGPVNYDGQRVRIEALLHSTVQPEHYVAGEFFRAGIVCDSDDTGAGGIRIRGVVFQNLCLNLIVLDEAWQEFGSIVHKGSPRRMVQAVKEALQAANDSLEHFRQAWGYACVTPALTQEQINLGREISALACFRGILQRELVKVPGKVEVNAKMLLEAWNADESSATQETDLSKAAVVNAFTRIAHEREDLDAWTADDISAQAGRLLLRKQPLPFELLEA